MSNYVATFHSHYGALAFFRRVKSLGISANMMPVPRRVSSSCGTGVRFECGQSPASLADDEVDKIFSFINDEYTLVYEQ